MLGSLQRFLGDFFGSSDGNNSLNDPRKREYGNLQEIRNVNKEGIRRTGVRTKYRQRLEKRNRARGNDSLNVASYTRKNGSKRIRKQNTQKPGAISSIWKNLKTVFSNEEKDLTLLQQACGNVNTMLSGSKRMDVPEERRRLRERMARSEAFKRKLLEIKYDDKMLEQLRRGRSRLSKFDGSNIAQQSHNITDDQVALLQRRINELENNLQTVSRELQITQKRLKFAQEKNTLLESLLDDANIDSEYVKSRRDMKNIQRENLKPESELPPSPRRTVNPLFTSSPMRNPSGNINSTLQEARSGSAADDFYNKYPKIPETESLMKAQRTHSLSPIRIDYSKYSV